MLIYLLFIIISLLVFVGIVALYGNVRKKYRKLFRKIMAVCFVFFLIGSVNLLFFQVTKNFEEETDITSLEENVDALNDNIALKNSSIEELEDLDQVLSDE